MAKVISIGNQSFESIREKNNFYIDKILDEEVYYYIKNNVIIKFSSAIEPMMIYTNAPIEKLRDLKNKIYT